MQFNVIILNKNHSVLQVIYFVNESRNKKEKP